MHMYTSAGPDEDDLPTPDELADYSRFFKAEGARVVLALLSKTGECKINDLPSGARSIVGGMNGVFVQHKKPHRVRLTREGKVILKRVTPE
ncbi:MAG: hypothetical protein JWN89_522 [Parcubacteria group bacterium]|nr:hypothetical protein [Parcubacteria group bacterium]